VSEAGFDVVVVGAGMGGLSAAVAAAEDEARVLLLEKGAEPGGSFALAGGYVWTLDTVETYDELIPHGDAALGHLVIEDYEFGIEWLREHGARLEWTERGLGHHKRFGGHRIVPDTVTGGVRPLLAALEAAGGTLATGAAVTELLRGEGDEVRGVRYRDQDGAHEVGCAAVVLATGGFQANLEMMARYVSPFADRAWVRSNPGSTGDGLRMALAAGAGASRGLNGFYGHTLPAPPAQIEEEAFRKLSQFYSGECIVLNQQGRRFADESLGDEVVALNLIRETGAEGYIVFDAATHGAQVQESPFPDMDPFDPLERVRAAGGVVLSAETIEDLARQLLDRYGVPGRNLLETIAEVNEAAASGDDLRLSVPRRDSLRACSQPPFYAVPIRPGVTFTEGGVRVDAEGCQVLAPDGRPVPGLFAAGADVGGVSIESYAGGLAPALITGLRAGVFAARSVATVG
jgi:succinate dehydrogenase/fumarate reductase flavoprotein subunit